MNIKLSFSCLNQVRKHLKFDLSSIFCKKNLVLVLSKHVLDLHFPKDFLL